MLHPADTSARAGVPLPNPVYFEFLASACETEAAHAIDVGADLSGFETQAAVDLHRSFLSAAAVAIRELLAMVRS